VEHTSKHSIQQLLTVGLEDLFGLLKLSRVTPCNSETTIYNFGSLWTSRLFTTVSICIFLESLQKGWQISFKILVTGDI